MTSLYHLAHQDLAWAWRQRCRSSSIPAAMVYFAAYDHKKRLNSPFSCALCGHLNLLNWAQTWIRAVVVQVHTPTLELGSGQVCISWVTSRRCHPFLPCNPLTLLPPCWHEYFYSHSLIPVSDPTKKIGLWCWAGIFFFKPGQFPTRFPCRAVQTPALAQKQRQQHCRRLSDRSLRGSVLFQQKVRPIAKYQLQKNLSKLELHTTFPITAGKITGISHLRQ